MKRRGGGRCSGERRGVEAVALELDAGNIASFDAFVESVKDALSKIGATRFDFLVNNAGNSHRNMPFETATEEELDSIYNVHFKGVFEERTSSYRTPLGLERNRSGDLERVSLEGRSALEFTKILKPDGHPLLR